ncbi:MAG: hypothetical protein ACXABK_07645 [Candidatus Heimdallarchaeaceae archaeon]
MKNLIHQDYRGLTMKKFADFWSRKFRLKNKDMFFLKRFRLHIIISSIFGILLLGSTLTMTIVGVIDNLSILIIVGILFTLVILLIIVLILIPWILAYREENISRLIEEFKDEK